MSNPTLVSGKWLVLKDPDDIDWYKFNFANDLTDSQTTIHPTIAPTIICSGVSLATHPDGLPNVKVVGTEVQVFLGGFDLTNNALNFCTIRLRCANGAQKDRTQWYVREDH